MKHKRQLQQPCWCLAALLIASSSHLVAAERLTSADLASAALRGNDQPAPTTRAPAVELLRGTSFPALPPDPYEQAESLPDIEQQFLEFGGSSIFHSTDEREANASQAHSDGHGHHEPLRLPEDWQEPKPVTFFSPFLGPGPIHPRPHLHWPGCNGYTWEPRFVGYGSYQLFGFAFEENEQRRDAIGHQLLIDLDLRLTGTERFHVQFRPFGEGATGGSYYQFNSPAGYVDNSTATPDRYWVEGELHSVLGGFLDPFKPLDFHVVGGKFPVLLQNSLLLNDDIIGYAVNKNNFQWGLSNLNLQFIHGINDVDSTVDEDPQLFLFQATADRWGAFWQSSYGYLRSEDTRESDAHYFAISRTALFGPYTVALRFLSRWENTGDSGQLYVLESNRSIDFEHACFGVESAAIYLNAFRVTEGWIAIAGGNFNRLRTAFETNPLTRLAAGLPTQSSWGMACGIQLFRHHEDESLTPEFAFEAPSGQAVTGFGLRYLRKTSARTFFECLGVVNLSDERSFRRNGVFLAETIVF